MIRMLLLVGLGGGIGSIGRYCCQRWISAVFPHAFPWGTFLVNISGCFIIGLLWGLSIRSVQFSDNWKLFLMTGICGGFTTFSAFSLESVALLRAEKIGLFILYITCSVVIGLLATLLAIRLTQS